MGETFNVPLPELEVDITENMSVDSTVESEAENFVESGQEETKETEGAILEESEVAETGSDGEEGQLDSIDSQAIVEGTDSMKDEKTLSTIEMMAQSIAELKLQVQSIESVNRQIFDETRRSLNSLIKTNDRLHAENQKLKEDMYSKMLKPVLMGVCQVANNLNKDINKETDERTKERLLDVRDDVIDVCLSNLGVEVYEAGVGDDFDEMRHRLVKSIETDDSDKHRKVQEVLGQGYLWRKNDEMIVLEPCKVNVYNVNHNK